MLSLRDYILEKFVAKFDKKIELEFTINKSGHAEERQSRHGEDNIISDDEMLETMRKASERIVEDIIANNIDLGDRFIVRDAHTDLNIVCQLHPGASKDKLRVDVVTVIRTDNFWNTQKNWVVMVR